MSDKDAPPKAESTRAYERGAWLGLTLFIGGIALYVAGIVAGIATATPETTLAVAGLSGLMTVAGIVILILKAVGDRMRSREDRYYSRNVDH